MNELSLIILPSYFIFLVLFFNQIDGINGLAATTFLVTILLLSFFLENLLIIIPIAGAVFCYLLINLKGKVGIQGEAGSFFMGAFIFIVSLKTDLPFHNSFSILFLFPILLDISSTTVVRYYLKKNILDGHRSNLYQKLVAKYKVPSIISFTFGFFQLIVGLSLIYALEKFDNNIATIIYLGFISSLTFIFIKISLLINKKEILNY